MVEAYLLRIIKEELEQDEIVVEGVPPRIGEKYEIEAYYGPDPSELSFSFDNRKEEILDRIEFHKRNQGTYQVSDVKHSATIFFDTVHHSKISDREYSESRRSAGSIKESSSDVSLPIVELERI